MELRKMKHAFARGRDLVRDTRDRITRHGLRHTIEVIEREADLTRKHRSSAEVVLSFLAGLTVGSVLAAHDLLVPRSIDVFVAPPDDSNKNQE